MRVQQVRLLRARLPAITSRAIRGLTSTPHRTRPYGTPAHRGRRRSAARRARDVEAEEARVDPALAQRGQQREQVVLGAADASPACGHGGLSREQPPVQGLQLVGHALRSRTGARTSSPPAAPRAARSAGSRGEPHEPARERRRRRRPATRKPLSPSRTTVGRAARAVATTGRRRPAPRSRRPARPRSRTSAARRRMPRTSPRMSLLEADEAAAVRDAELARERLRLGALLAVPDEHECRVHPVATSTRSVRSRSSGRLIAVNRPAQPTRTSSSAAELGPIRRAPPRRRRSRPAGRTRTGSTTKRSAGATPTGRGRRAPPR